MQYCIARLKCDASCQPEIRISLVSGSGVPGSGQCAALFFFQGCIPHGVDLSCTLLCYKYKLIPRHGPPTAVHSNRVVGMYMSCVIVCFICFTSGCPCFARARMSVSDRAPTLQGSR
jgi:hypothetical protein